VPTGGSEAAAAGAVRPPSPAVPETRTQTVGAPATGQVVTPAPPVVAGRGTEIRALPPRPAAGAQPASAGTKKARPVRVVIDPGHGGKDPGAKGPGGTEKESVLDISKRVAAKLRKDLGIEVHMTRSEDVYTPLEERKNLANRLEADLFVSIHANASRNTKVFGIETYYLKNTNDRATLRLARLENGVDMLIKGGDVSTDADLSYILSDIIQGQKEADSILLANHIQAALCGHLRKGYDSIKSLGVKQGPFLVLDGTYMPSVLVEAGFVSNSHEGGRLRASAYREAVAEGIYRGIKAYLEDDRVNDLT
jgi:N-acetylmuramoyl-L-alanine amidase